MKSVPMLPPAPGLFSTRTGTPSALEMKRPICRDRWSEPPPAA